MENTNHLTAGYAPDLARQIRQSVPGMAHFAGTGPSNATCGECGHLGYERFSKAKAWRFGGCAKFFKLTGNHSPKAIPPSTPACRHFEQRAEGK